MEAKKGGSSMTREEQFEKMLADVQANYTQLCSKMEALKAQGKEKTATYRQLWADKLQCQYVLNLYKVHGLLEE